MSGLFMKGLISILILSAITGCSGAGSGDNVDFLTYLATSRPRSLSQGEVSRISSQCDATTQLVGRFSGHLCVLMYVDSFYSSDFGTGLTLAYPTASLQSAINNAKTYFNDISSTQAFHVIIIERGSLPSPSTLNYGQVKSYLHFYSGTSITPLYEFNP